MEPRIKQGWLRTLIFFPIWGFFSSVIGTIGLFILMFINGVDFTNQEDAQLFMKPIMDGDFSSPIMGFTMFFQLLSTTLAVFFMMKFIDRKPFSSVGLSTVNLKNDIIDGLSASLILIGGTFFILWLFGAIIITEKDFNASIFLVSFILLFNSFDQELMFRGYILNNLMDSFENRWVALGVSSIFFSVLHFGNPEFFSSYIPLLSMIFGGTILLGLSYTFTKNLWFPTFFHFGWNFLQGLFGFEISGIGVDSWSIYSHKNNENFSDLITGGAFGIEGSIVSLFLIFIGIYIIFRKYEKK